jgi:glycosyl transferase family 87
MGETKVRTRHDGISYGRAGEYLSTPSLRRRETTAVATAIVCAGLATYFVAGNAFSLALMAGAAAYAYSFLRQGRISREKAVGLIGGAAAVGLGRILVAAVRPFLDPSNWGTWDFLCFYVHGSVAIRGLNVYDPANYELVFNQLSIPFDPTPGFREEILNMGFPYPPPTLLVFAWLGLLPFGAAQVLWYLLVLAGAVLVIFLVVPHIPTDVPRLERTLFAAALVMLSHAATVNMAFGQTHWFGLAATLVAMRASQRLVSGVCAALALLIKPFLLCVPAYLFLQRHWRSLAASIVTYAVVALLVVILCGFETTAVYFSVSPADRVPVGTFFQPINQSLLGTILRLAQPFTPLETSPIAYPLFLVSALVVLTSTALLAVRLARTRDPLLLSLLLTCALLVYPGTHTPYSVFLIVPTVQLLERHPEMIRSPGLFALIIGLLYFLMGAHSAAFSANLAAWLAVLVSATASIA